MPDGTSTSSPTDSWSERPIHNQQRMKIICIGAGASGLLFAYKLQRSFENFDLTIYDKNIDLGGTWLENKYPGCACDIAAHAYTWTFEPNPNWSSVYAGSDEIYHYFNNFSEKYGLRKYCHFNKRVTRAEWKDDQGQWIVEITDAITGEVTHDSCHILINGMGVLNKWKWPDAPGRESFEGLMMHTAQYDRSIDLKGKVVALIGTGSSALQTLPAILDDVKKVITFNRSPAFVMPIQGYEQRQYTDEEKKEFNEKPEKLSEHRKALETALNSLFGIFIEGSEIQKKMTAGIRDAMREVVKGSGLEDSVIPYKWGVGCRRITPGVGYLEALVSEKTEVVKSSVKSFTPKGCIDEDGKEYHVDVIICATGFDTTYLPQFPIIGAGGVALTEVWKEEPINYFAVAAPGFPNYFMSIGPNSPIGNGPVLVGIEAQMDYILKMINRWQTENIHSFSPNIEAVHDFMDFKNQFMQKTVWESECRSWYKAGSAHGKVTALWPGSTLHYLEAMQEPRYEDWDFKRVGNRFAYLGNGFSQVESDYTTDLAYYMRGEDDGPLLGRAKLMRAIAKAGSIQREEGILTGIF